MDLIDASLLTDIERCRTRIEALRNLGAGWLDGDGHAVTVAAITQAERLIGARPGLAASYHIYPTVQGGVIFEFVHAGWDYAIEAMPNGDVAIYGVQVDGPGDLDVAEFPGLDHEALALLDRLTGADR